MDEIKSMDEKHSRLEFWFGLVFGFAGFHFSHNVPGTR